MAYRKRMPSTDSNKVCTVQAAAMVGMCLAAGYYIIAFGAGRVWPRS